MELQNIIDILEERVSSMTNMLIGEFETIDVTTLTLEEKEKFILDADVEIRYTKHGFSARNSRGDKYADGTKEDVINVTYLRLVYFPVAQSISRRISVVHAAGWPSLYEGVIKGLDGSYRQRIEREDVVNAVSSIVRDFLGVQDLKYRIGLVAGTYEAKHKKIEEFILASP